MTGILATSSTGHKQKKAHKCNSLDATVYSSARIGLARLVVRSFAAYLGKKASLAGMLTNSRLQDQQICPNIPDLLHTRRQCMESKILILQPISQMRASVYCWPDGISSEEPR